MPHKPTILPACAALCLLTLIAYSNSFSAGFALDNQVLLLHDPRVQQATPANVGLIFGHSYWWPNGEAGIYRPLTTLTYLLNYSILGNGTNPAGYHWINLLLHAANVLLVFAIVPRIVGDHRQAWLTAALWAVHPVLTESVTNIIGRADLLAATGVLCGFLMFLKYAESRRMAWLTGIMAATSVGVFSKESAVVLPGLILLHEASLSKRWRPALCACAATLPPMALMLWQRAVVLSASAPAEFPFVDNPIIGAHFATGRLTAITVLVRYLWLSLWPVKLSSDYSYSQIPLARGAIGDWVACAIMASVLAAIVIAYRRNRPAFFFAGFAFLNLLPASNLLFPIGTIMAERLLYLPLVGLAACSAMAIGAVQARLRVASAVACVLLAAFTTRTWLRNLDWKDDLTMAEAGIVTSPKSFKVHRLLAEAVYKTDPARALAEADKSVAILNAIPDARNVAQPWTLAANLHLSHGDYDRALQLALRSTAIAQSSEAAYRIQTACYLHKGRPDKALEAALEAKALNPRNPENYGAIADAYIGLARGEDAAKALAEGMFATSDMGLRRDLVTLYSKGVDSTGCAVVPGPNGPALNPACEMVRRDLCIAAARAHREELAGRLNCPK